MNPLLMSLLLIVALAIFGRTMYHKIRLLMALEPVDRFNHIKERVLIMWWEGKKSGLLVSCTLLFSGDSVFC